MMRVLLIVSLVFILVACQPAPATVPLVSPTETPVPSETPVPIPTATQTSTPTIVPTATISPDVLKGEAGPLCEKALSASVENGVFTPPFAVLRKAVYADSPTWGFGRQLPHLWSSSSTDVRTIFCISESRTRQGTYTDGAPAYQLSWSVRAVSWPEGKVIAQNTFIGSTPPQIKRSSGSAEGASPYKKFSAWILDQVDHPNFFKFSDAITTIAISPNGGLAAFGTALDNRLVDKDYQAKIILFNPVDLQTISTLDGHTGMVTALAFSPDGKLLASSGYDLSVKFWDVATGNFAGQVSDMEPANALLFSPDGTKLAVISNRELALIDPLSMQIEQSFPDASGESLAFSPDGNYLFFHSGLSGVKVIDLAAGAVTLRIPDGEALIATAMASLNEFPTSEASGFPIITYPTPDTVDGFALSSDGTKMITYTIDRSVDSDSGAENVRLATWDPKTGDYLSEIKFASYDEQLGNTDLIRIIKISPNGNLLATGHGSEIWLWDMTAWQVIRKLTGHIDSINDLVFTPDGIKILSAGGDGTIRVWSLEE